MTTKKCALSLRIFSTIVFPLIIIFMLIFTGVTLEHSKTITPDERTFIVDKAGISVLKFDPQDKKTNTTIEIVELGNPNIQAFMVEHYVNQTLISTYKVNVYGSSIDMKVDLVTKLDDNWVGYIYYQTPGTITFEYTAIFGQIPLSSQMYISYQPNAYDILPVLLTMIFGSVILYIINYKHIKLFGYQKHKKQYKTLVMKEKAALILISLFVPLFGSIMYVLGATDEKDRRRMSIGNYAVLGFIPLFVISFISMTLKVLKVI